MRAELKHTYGDVVCVESVAETESVTQQCRGDKGSVPMIGLSTLFLPVFPRLRTHESATVASARRGRGKVLESPDKEDTDSHPGNNVRKDQYKYYAYSWKRQLS